VKLGTHFTTELFKFINSGSCMVSQEKKDNKALELRTMCNHW